jgi:hypothetical protein
MTKHRIMCRSSTTGIIGRGDYLDISKEQAERSAATLNERYPRLLHWVEAEPAAMPAEVADSMKDL